MAVVIEAESHRIAVMYLGKLLKIGLKASDYLNLTSLAKN